MIALLEALPALLNALLSLFGVGYVAWKLESTGAADQIAGGAGAISAGVGGAARGLGDVPTGVLVVGGLLAALVLLRR
jgi:hypothetical protein